MVRATLGLGPSLSTVKIASRGATVTFFLTPDDTLSSMELRIFVVIPVAFERDRGASLRMTRGTTVISPTTALVSGWLG